MVTPVQVLGCSFGLWLLWQWYAFPGVPATPPEDPPLLVHCPVASYGTLRNLPASIEADMWFCCLNPKIKLQILAWMSSECRLPLLHVNDHERSNSFAVLPYECQLSAPNALLTPKLILLLNFRYDNNDNNSSIIQVIACWAHKIQKQICLEPT